MSRRLPLVGVVFLALLASRPAPVLADEVYIPSIVVTPYYVPLPVARAGSAVSVITREQIQRASPSSVVTLLKTVPGVTVVESGGPGATAEVRLRGGETGHTLVLIDGVRVNDPATARDEFDFSLISLANVERIEVLRGPQSAIYGSDAMGGVVNIITRRQQGGPSFSASVEGGSYGTHVERLSGGVAKRDFSLLMSGEHIASSGFSRVGSRDSDESDAFERWNGSVAGAYTPSDGARLEFGLNGTKERSDYDGSPPSSGSKTVAANAKNVADKALLSGYGRLSLGEPGDRFTQSITGFFTAAHRLNTEPTSSFTTLFDFTSNDFGAEYQATLDTAKLGQLLAGVRVEQEHAVYVPTTSPVTPGFDSTTSRYALFAGDQVSLWDNMHLSFTGRYDADIGGEAFLTGRATAAYEIPATETKLRASIGTGAKRPTPFMIANNFGVGVLTPLLPEHSLGADVGIDQTMFDGRLTMSATAFDSRFTDLLTFDSPSKAYVNIGSAEMMGVELASTVSIVPSRLSLTGSYTYLDARDLATGKLLARRPMNSGSLTLAWTGPKGLDLALTGTFVGDRFNRANEAQPIAAYSRFDLSGSYPLNGHTKLFGRIENLTNVQYQDPWGYNTPGFSAYFGLSWRQ
jgi:vitamin B12 transporter